jgi:hypothetical protein
MTANDNMPDTVIAEWPRSHGEVFRLQLHCFQGRPVFSIRVWYQDRQGQLRPGKDGLTAHVVHLAPLLDGLVDAYRLAGERGLLEPGGHNAAS